MAIERTEDERWNTDDKVNYQTAAIDSETNLEIALQNSLFLLENSSIFIAYYGEEFIEFLRCKLLVLPICRIAEDPFQFL